MSYREGDRPALSTGTAPGEAETNENIDPKGRALEELSRRLHQRMDHLDPTEDSPEEWEQLTELDREFYRDCVSDLADRVDLWRQLFG